LLCAIPALLLRSKSLNSGRDDSGGAGGAMRRACGGGDPIAAARALTIAGFKQFLTE
jgi:hypothetical protein